MSMTIHIKHENSADHPRYDDEVAACGNRHGLSIRQWGFGWRTKWFCCNCGQRVTVQVQGELEQ